MLTPIEEDALALSVELALALGLVVSDGPQRHNDLSELVGHIHGIQSAVMAQSCARENPTRFRLLGEAAL